jgi:hypothetical protein
MKAKSIHALEFVCQSPLKFYERCAACPRFSAHCPDLELGKEILRGRKKLAYDRDESPDAAPVSSFACLAPLYYFEKTRSKCSHGGRCREEGLLLALLEGKRTLNYAPVAVIDLPTAKLRRPAPEQTPAPPKSAQA